MADFTIAASFRRAIGRFRASPLFFLQPDSEEVAFWRLAPGDGRHRPLESQKDLEPTLCCCSHSPNIESLTSLHASLWPAVELRS
jgi:hypothetical protein